MDDRRLDERRETCLIATFAGCAIISSFTMVLRWVWEQMNVKILTCSRKRTNAFSLTSIYTSVRLPSNSGCCMMYTFMIIFTSNIGTSKHCMFSVDPVLL